MRIVMACIGSRGDAQPYVGYALALQRIGGHEVRLLIPSDYITTFAHPELSLKGFSNWSMSECLALPMVDDLMATGDVGKLVEVFKIYNTAPGRGTSLVEDIVGLAKGWADVIVAFPILQFAWHAAESLRIPIVGLCFQPLVPCRVFPFTPAPPPRWAAFLLWKIFYGMADKEHSDEMVEWRKTAGLPPFLGGWERTYKYKMPIIAALDAELWGGPYPEWAEMDMQVVAQPVLDAADLKNEQPTAELRSFVEAGDAPVYIGWGSMVLGSGTRMTELAVRAAHALGRRAVLFRGSSNIPSFDMGIDKLDATQPEAAALAAWARINVFVTAGAPHGWLFPRCAAIVHHGGAGTINAARLAGVPQVITPFQGDQTTHQTEMVAKGVAVPGAPQFNKLTAQLLAELIDAATAAEGRFAAAAREMGEQLDAATAKRAAQSVGALERAAQRNIWKEEEARAAKGIQYAVKPPNICCSRPGNADNAVGEGAKKSAEVPAEAAAEVVSKRRSSLTDAAAYVGRTSLG